MCFDYIYSNLFPDSSSLSYPPNIVSFLFKKKNSQDQCVLLKSSWTSGLPLESAQVTRATLWEKTDPSFRSSSVSHSPAQGRSVCPSALSPCWVWSGLGLCGSHAHCHNCCQFRCATALLHAETFPCGYPKPLAPKHKDPWTLGVWWWGLAGGVHVLIRAAFSVFILCVIAIYC